MKGLKSTDLCGVSLAKMEAGSFAALAKKVSEGGLARKPA